MKPDERRLLDELRRPTSNGSPATPRDVANGMGMHPKRCLALCQGWWAKGWLEQSPKAGRTETFTTGRLTLAGMTAARGK